MITNCVITIYHKEADTAVFVKHHTSAWKENTQTLVTTKNGTEKIKALKLTFFPCGNIKVGDYVVLSSVDIQLTETNLKDYLIEYSPFKINSITECTLPNGNVHHIEVICV